MIQTNSSSYQIYAKIESVSKLAYTTPSFIAIHRCILNPVFPIWCMHLSQCCCLEFGLDWCRGLVRVSIGKDTWNTIIALSLIKMNSFSHFCLLRMILRSVSSELVWFCLLHEDLHAFQGSYIIPQLYLSDWSLKLNESGQLLSFQLDGLTQYGHGMGFDFWVGVAWPSAQPNSVAKLAWPKRIVRHSKSSQSNSRNSKLARIIECNASE